MYAGNGTGTRARVDRHVSGRCCVLLRRQLRGSQFLREQLKGGVLAEVLFISRLSAVCRRQHGYSEAGRI